MYRLIHREHRGLTFEFLEYFSREERYPMGAIFTVGSGEGVDPKGFGIVLTDKQGEFLSDPWKSHSYSSIEQAIEAIKAQHSS